MIKKDNLGMALKDYDEYKIFITKLEKIGMDLEGIIPYIRHTSFIPEGKPPCDICGGNVLIHGIGRYIICDCEDYSEDGVVIFICGYCIEHLENKWKIKLDFG